LMIKRRKEFPIMPMRYMAQNGIPIQHCTDSRPGIPISVSTEGMKTVMLEGYMVFLGPDIKQKIFLTQFYCTLLSVLIQSQYIKSV
jgi:hypothetical protein